MSRVFSNASFGPTVALLKFDNTKFEFNAIQNKAVFSSLNTLSSENLEKFTKLIRKNLDLSEIKTSSNSVKNYEFSNEISFKDKISNNTINLKLSDENLEKLKTYFGSQDFDKIGRIILKGEAESFVSGWFGDIAYKRNYVGADSDKNGILSTEEKGRVLAGYNIDSVYELDGALVKNVKMNGLSSYLLYSRHYDAPLLSSIEEELNHSLKADTNMDGYLSLGELHSNEELIKLVKKSIKDDGTLPTEALRTKSLFELQRESMEALRVWLEAQLERQLNLQSHTNFTEFVNVLGKELHSLSLNLKVNEEFLLKNTDKLDLTKDLKAVISELRETALEELSIDLSV